MCSGCRSGYGDPPCHRAAAGEVAQLVAISHDYYTRIEQGRPAPSEPVLAAIVQVLRLTPDERLYVEGLARQAGQRAAPPRRRAPTVRPQLQRLLDQLTDTPAFVVGKHLDYLAWHRLAAALLLDVDQLPPGPPWAPRRSFTPSWVPSPSTGTRSPPTTTRTST